jgi:hypothetical protein
MKFFRKCFATIIVYLFFNVVLLELIIAILVVSPDTVVVQK